MARSIDDAYVRADDARNRQMQIKLQEQLQQEAEQRKRRDEAANIAAQAQIQPVMGADGNIDILATRIAAAKAMGDIGVKQRMAESLAAAKGKTMQRGAELAVKRNDGESDDDYAARIENADYAQHLKKTTEESSARADAWNQRDSAVQKDVKAQIEAEGLKPDTPEYKNRFSWLMKYNKGDADLKHAMLLVKDMEDSGLIPDDRSRDKEVARLLRNPDGKPFSLTPAQIKDLEGENALIRGLGDVQKRIADFEGKYGAGSFDNYVGPWDAKKQEWTLKFGANPTDQDKEAGRIGQMFSELYNEELKRISGGAVTAPEAMRNEIAKGTLSGATFKNSLQGWRESRNSIFQNKRHILRDLSAPESIWDVTSSPSVQAEKQPNQKANPTQAQTQTPAWAGDPEFTNFLKKSVTGGK